MKRLLLSFFIVFTSGAYSQKYRPIDSNTVWHTKCLRRICTPSCCSVYENASFQFHGYELNNGNKWMKLYSSAISDWVMCQTMCYQIMSCNKPPNYTNQFYGYILNDSSNKRVYFTPTLTPNYTPTANDVAYDFLNKNLGDSISYRGTGLWYQPKFSIQSIDSILLAGNYHKRYYVRNNTIFNYEFCIIEGIGSTKGPWNSIFFDGEHSSALICFSKPTNGISVTPNYTTFVSSSMPCATINVVPEIELPSFSIHPNPASTFINVDHIEFQKAEVLDVFGKIVCEQTTPSTKINIQSLPAGLYFLRLRSNNVNYISKFIKE